MRNMETIRELQNSRAFRRMEGTRWRAFHLDVAAGLLAAIIPAIRPVETLLLTTAEKWRLRRVVELMA